MSPSGCTWGVGGKGVGEYLKYAVLVDFYLKVRLFRFFTL